MVLWKYSYRNLAEYEEHMCWTLFNLNTASEMNKTQDLQFLETLKLSYKWEILNKWSAL